MQTIKHDLFLKTDFYRIISYFKILKYQTSLVYSFSSCSRCLRNNDVYGGWLEVTLGHCVKTDHVTCLLSWNKTTTQHPSSSVQAPRANYNWWHGLVDVIQVWGSWRTEDPGGISDSSGSLSWLNEPSHCRRCHWQLSSIVLVSKCNYPNTFITIHPQRLV